MKIPFSSLRTGIIADLALLIVSAMLLINLVMIKFSERDLMEAKVREGQLLLRVLSQKISSNLDPAESGLSGIPDTEKLRKAVIPWLNPAGFDFALVLDSTGRRILSGSKEETRAAFGHTLEALRSGVWGHAFHGTTWGVIWPGPEQVHVFAPIRRSGRTLGAVTVSASLKPLYERLRRSEKVILLYIILNTVVLLGAGFYLLSRTVVKPIHRLLSITDEFKEGESFPQPPASSRNEISDLYRSLNLMLTRLQENKEELKSHIASLKEANRELKRAQEETIRSEKLASVGRLAASVAHEIGNPVGIILGYLELIRTEELSREEEQDFLKRIEDEITRVNQIIRQLLDFSRPASGKPREVSIHQLLKETAAMLEPKKIMDRLEMDLRLEAAVDTVRADPNQLKQVFLNIMMNAADALEQEGPAGSDRPEGRLAITSRVSGGVMTIRFEDNGPGIAAQDLDKIFDPFYTTKEPGKGTGLGLSVSYRILEELGGRIRAESSPGKGTAIAVDIPVAGMKK